VATADTDKDIINLANLDGTDSGGLKTVGLRGGLLGELFLLLRKLRRLDAYASLSADESYFEQLITGFWNSFVGDGFSVLIGVDASFEKNVAAVVEGVSLDRLDAEAVAGISAEEFTLLIEYLKIHLRNSYLDEAFPQLVDRRDRRMLQVRVPDSAQPDGKQPDPADPDDNQAIERDLNAKIAELDALLERDPETDPDIRELDRFLDKMLKLLLSENGLKGARVTRFVPKVFEPTQVTGDDGEPRDGPPVPRVFALLLPAAPVPEEEALPSPPPADAAVVQSPSKAPDSVDGAPPVDKSADVRSAHPGRAEERARRRAAAPRTEGQRLRAGLRTPSLEPRPAQERPRRGLPAPADPQKPHAQVRPAARRCDQKR